MTMRAVRGGSTRLPTNVSHDESMNFRELDRPTLIQVTAPWCTHCRSMSQDMADLRDAFAGQVDFVTIDVSSSLDPVKAMGVKGTPTLIGVRQGVELFRETGRRSRVQLMAMLENLESGHRIDRPRTGDAAMTIAAGSILCGLGVITGPAWGLVAIGAAVLGLGMMRAMRVRNG